MYINIQYMKENYNEATEMYINSKTTLREICKKFEIERTAFAKYLKHINVSTRKKISSDDTLFEKIDNEEKAYWLGFLYADGSITYNLEKTKYVIELGLAIKDYNHLEKFKKFLKCKNNIKLREKTKSCRLIICSKKMCEDLIKLGCVPNKSLILKYPTEEQVPLELQKHFIRGYFDGDGSIGLSKTRTTPKITLIGTIEFINDFKKLFPKGIIQIKDKRHLNNTFSIRFNVQQGIGFLYTIYKDSEIYLDRKYERYINLFNCRSGKKFLELLESKYGEGCEELKF